MALGVGSKWSMCSTDILHSNHPSISLSNTLIRRSLLCGWSSYLESFGLRPHFLWLTLTTGMLQLQSHNLRLILEHICSLTRLCLEKEVSSLVSEYLQWFPPELLKQMVRRQTWSWQPGGRSLLIPPVHPNWMWPCWRKEHLGLFTFVLTHQLLGHPFSLVVPVPAILAETLPTCPDTSSILPSPAGWKMFDLST